MEVFFSTKEESNEAQLAEFLAMDGGSRLQAYLRLLMASNLLPVKGRKQPIREGFEITIYQSMENWNDEILKFVELASRHEVKMILVGGGAVNLHGYQRHSVNVNFWIDTTAENFNKLVLVFREMGYDLSNFPDDVMEGKQNVSVKFSPMDLRLELITQFSLDKSFDDAYSESVTVKAEDDYSKVKWNVLSYDDLIDSKLKSQRTKDQLDVQELERIRKGDQ